MSVRLPNRSQRTVLVGRTGTGKTVAGLWHLSNYDLEYPWVVIDFKIDEHINSIEKAQHISFDYVPTKKDSGLFVLHPIKTDVEGTSKDKSNLESYMWKLWERENVGVFCDEAFMFGGNSALDSCLTQGRSKRVPIILCTQRPVWISRFAFSEADFIQVFALNDSRDKQTVESFTPIDFDGQRLGEHESWYFDVGKNKLAHFRPVPDMEHIRSVFDAKLHRRRVRL